MSSNTRTSKFSLDPRSGSMVDFANFGYDFYGNLLDLNYEYAYEY